jgi:hypothetical protein
MFPKLWQNNLVILTVLDLKSTYMKYKLPYNGVANTHLELYQYSQLHVPSGSPVQGTRLAASVILNMYYKEPYSLVLCGVEKFK